MSKYNNNKLFNIIDYVIINKGCDLMAIFNMVIDNYDPKGKITACRFFDTTEEKRIISGYMSFEIRRNGHFDFQKVYEKNCSNEESIDRISMTLTDDEITEIKYFISGKKDAKKIFDEYVKALDKQKVSEQPIEQTPQVVTSTPEPIINKTAKEGVVTSNSNDIKLLYYKLSDTEVMLGIRLTEETEPIYICTYTMVDGQKCIDTEMKRKLSVEEIENIKSLIESNEDAKEVFDIYLSKINSKTF